MTLEQYYHATDANKSSIFAPEELTSLRASITSFFKGFEEAAKLDCKAVGCFILPQVPNPYATHAYLQSHRTELRGFAQYLLDFRGFNDEILKREKFNLEDLAYMIFEYHYAFEGAHFRLLELTDSHYAVLFPEKNNVANYIISNIDKYSTCKREKMYKTLKAMKKNVEQHGSKFENYVYQHMLYKMLKKNISIFKR